MLKLRMPRRSARTAVPVLSRPKAASGWTGTRAAQLTITTRMSEAIVVAPREVMPGMPGMVLTLTEMATMIRPASAARACGRGGEVGPVADGYVWLM
jgi:hypothetical protein